MNRSSNITPVHTDTVTARSEPLRYRSRFFILLMVALALAAPSIAQKEGDKDAGKFAMPGPSAVVDSAAIIGIIKSYLDKGKKIKPIEKKNLVQKIGKLISFRANAIAKEKKRVDTIISQTKFGDSIRALSQYMQQLDISFNSLTAYLEDSLKKQYAVIPGHLDSINVQLKALADKVNKLHIDTLPRKKAPTVVVPGDISDDSDTTAETLEVPQATGDNPSEEEARKKRSKIAVIRKSLLNNPVVQTTYTSTRPDYLDSFHLYPTRKAELYAFYTPSHAYDVQHTSAAIYNALVYDKVDVDVATGSLVGYNVFKADKLVRTIAKDQCSIILTLSVKKGNAGTLPFLINKDARLNLNKQLQFIAKEKIAGGINFSFDRLSPEEAVLFSDLVTLLSGSFKTIDTAFKIYVTLPAVDELNAYRQLSSIDGMVYRYFIDFTRTSALRSPGPLDPLSKGPNSIQNSITNYIKTLPSSKLVCILPYGGVLYQPVTRKGKNTPSYLPYGTIQNLFNWVEQADVPTTTVYIDTFLTGKQSNARIWFDNAATLGKKLDYCLDEKLSGVAIKYLGDERNSNDLTDEVLYKLFKVDTLLVKSYFTGVPQLTFFERLQQRLALYSYILTNPCRSCFDSGYVSQYVRNLGIDSLVYRENVKVWQARQHDPSFEGRYITTFDYLNNEMNVFFLTLTLVILLLLVLCAAYYFYKQRTAGDSWKRSKTWAKSIIILFILFLFAGFTFLFTDDLIPYFGVSGDYQEKMYKDHYSAITSESNLRMMHITNCTPDPGCINIPFTTLAGIIIFGLLVGFAVTRYFINPIFRDNEKP